MSATAATIARLAMDSLAQKLRPQVDLRERRKLAELVKSDSFKSWVKRSIERRKEVEP